MIEILVGLWIGCVLVMVFDPEAQDALVRLTRRMLDNWRWIMRKLRSPASGNNGTERTCFRANDSEAVSRSVASLATAPLDSDTEAYVWAKRADEVTKDDIYHLAALIGWNAVERLNIDGALS